MIRLALALSAFVVTAAPAFSQEDFSEGPICVQNETALIIAEERPEDVGMNILARAPAKGKIRCEYVEQEGDWIIGQIDDPLYYQDLVGKYLVLTRSTGPDDNLVIFDLDDQSVVVDEWVGDGFLVSETDVTFWPRFEDGNAENCPEFEEYTSYGFGASIAREQVLDFATGTITATGEERCSATQ